MTNNCITEKALIMFVYSQRAEASKEAAFDDQTICEKLLTICHKNIHYFHLLHVKLCLAHVMLPI